MRTLASTRPAGSRPESTPFTLVLNTICSAHSHEQRPASELTWQLGRKGDGDALRDGGGVPDGLRHRDGTAERTAEHVDQTVRPDGGQVGDADTDARCVGISAPGHRGLGQAARRREPKL